jgi:hypothetical protein
VSQAGVYPARGAAHVQQLVGIDGDGSRRIHSLACGPMQQSSQTVETSPEAQEPDTWAQGRGELAAPGEPVLHID